jgi:hypothetical protein
MVIGAWRDSLLIQAKYTVQIDTSTFISQITADGLEPPSKLAIALAIVLFTTYASRLHRPSKNAQACGRTSPDGAQPIFRTLHNVLTLYLSSC